MKNNKKLKKYPLIIRFLHWLMAIILLTLIAVGWYMHQLPDDAANKYFLYPWHKSFGLLILFLWPIRLFVKGLGRRPLYHGLTDRQIKLAGLGHASIYMLIILIPVSGYIMSIAGGHDVAFFGYQLPALLAENKTIAGFAHEIHEYAPWLLLFVICAHVGAVIYHHRVDRVDVLSRML